MLSGSAETVAAAGDVTAVPAGIKSSGVAVSSIANGPEKTTGKGEQRPAGQGGASVLSEA